MTPKQNWFIYYKLPATDAALVAERVRVMQGALAAASGVHGRLLRRPEDGPVITFMETYEGIADPAAFEAQIADAAAHAGLPQAWLDARRTERFCEL